MHVLTKAVVNEVDYDSSLVQASMSVSSEPQDDVQGQPSVCSLTFLCWAGNSIVEYFMPWLLPEQACSLALSYHVDNTELATC